MAWHSSVDPALTGEETGAIDRAIRFYEEIIEAEPEEIAHYWYLGLAYLLAEREEEARATWLFVLGQLEETEIDTRTAELVAILEEEANRQAALEKLDRAWFIRQQILEIFPDDLVNILRSIELELILQYFTIERIEEWRAIERLETSSIDLLPVPLLLSILERIFAYPDDRIVLFARAILSRLPDKESFVQKSFEAIFIYKYKDTNPSFAIKLIEICLENFPENSSLYYALFVLCKYDENLSRCLELADKLYQNSRNEIEKIYSQHLRIYILQLMGDWLNITSPIKSLKKSIFDLVENEEFTAEKFIEDSLLDITSCLRYYEDNPVENFTLQKRLARFFQEKARQKYVIPRTAIERIPDKNLKIGYLAHTLRRHSVGWLSRWLFHYHDRRSFDVAIYLVNQPEDDLTRDWFRSRVERVYNLEPYPENIARKISEDGIDILIDLDSTTNNTSSLVMALKPAPVQVTWLGLDASGIPAIDYFIADPYVLPEGAEEYYSEKIIRLPNSYLSIDGFEVGIPTLRREMLGIEEEAIVYLTAQSGFKRNPDTVRLQMEILRAVPDSYLLIKGPSDRQTIRDLFHEIATEEGIDRERLRFLDNDPSEEIHRANLNIADVVLDTYPYNGATTTLEVLWMGIPLVTRVGQQFAARNSYTFLINAGITEGIAGSDREYVDWGIKLGKDSRLRREIREKLHRSRQIAPLWNAREFTKEMENAYRRMWEDYCQQEEREGTNS
ncbi:O-linked N-acetylglucosamine transferase, SPINDLY family protein [Pannus brasiliensis CCIBt3594]|uniref:O-linked N-acetylglucosamine transferase, SPINDLY family protein n=1 Tax=Pannus brasiliensis CCIBt3594 TaxID=1427578 RepID=A0AAW9QS47_9CHRO